MPAAGAVLLAVGLGVWLVPSWGAGDGGGGSGGGDGAAGAVPEEFLGTWRGQITDSDVTTGALEVTVVRGEVGDVVLRSRIRVSGSDVDCGGPARLLSAMGTELVVDASWRPAPLPESCPVDGEVRYRLSADGTVLSRSADAEGRYVADGLVRVPAEGSADGA
ncbi:hypothetical protein ACN20G_09820 [Streptomyces sp. BI20]|uniref:hypothetical protein n=1 Tax=Streptomyces sp. BI20 TaxID=3403460 RepID=UPI003C770296